MHAWDHHDGPLCKHERQVQLLCVCPFSPVRLSIVQIKLSRKGTCHKSPALFAPVEHLPCKTLSCRWFAPMILCLNQRCMLLPSRLQGSAILWLSQSFVQQY